MTRDKTTRLDQAFAVLAALERPLPDSERLSTALGLRDELVLTGASDAVRDAGESFGREMDAIVRRYPAESSDALPDFSDEDARELTIHLRQVAELIRDVETERILNRLRDHGRVLPEDEIHEVRRHLDWFIPHLIRGCHEQIAKLEQLDDPDASLPNDQRDSIPFFSLFLFSECQVADSIPVILKGLSLPGEGPFELFGDGVHEQAPRYLAQFLSDDLDQIDALISNSRINLYVRWSAAGSYKYLVRDQTISVADAVVRLDRLFQDSKIVAEDGSPGMEHSYELSAGIMDVIVSIGGSSRSTVCADDRNWDFIDESIINRGGLQVPPESPADGDVPDALRNLPPTRIEDCLEELRHWAAFEELGYEPPKESPAPKPSERPRPAVSRPRALSSPPAATKPISQATRVPRNAPCPCGSGKKYKHCCLRKET